MEQDVPGRPLSAKANSCLLLQLRELWVAIHSRQFPTCTPALPPCPPPPGCPFGVKADLRLEVRTTKKCPRAQVSLEKQTRGATGLAEQKETKETHGVSCPRWLSGATPAACTPSEPLLDGGNREGALQLLQQLPGGAAGPEAPPTG
ncbi:hypothetical protein D623_10010028 [Myotis brandtii]|uniref:Uncharacterized protein n=1 Tax=Myotis brandtii TaxID=109478 RepID=S7MGL0_MYOBR|nr:hypothetical protein D623_10010028 [Myotis brandtii]